MEYLLYLQNHPEGNLYPDYEIDEKAVVEEAHRSLQA